ncbi:uncharacterized protein TNCT_108831 [Trichonephila clavata]|uniref:Uncharacterized protein n=1 Tax=Trichonephila clavata TaxID=2740835 RepID=A0A8X6IXX3_TRICU|nr:uncharacterized protein TNCT_108831 [Trichonephila clavata]
MASTNDHSLIMDLSLPPSGNSSRPETPTYSNCARLQQTANDIKKFTTLTDGTNSIIKSMKYDGFDSDDDPSIQDLKCRLTHYQNYLAMAVKPMADEFCETSPLEKDKSVKGYASKVIKESSVSAVSAIVSTGNTPRKVFRILVFVLFTAGFLYQCIKFLTYILTYPTVVNIEIDRPPEYLAPAYTFCNYNRIKRSKFCSKYPNSCRYPNKELCNTYPPDYCWDNTTKVPKEDFIESFTMEDAMELGHDFKNLLLRGASKRAVKRTITKLETFFEESSNNTPTKLGIKLNHVQEMNKKIEELKDQYYENKDISDSELAEIETDL